jgi:ribose transport system permease protein
MDQDLLSRPAGPSSPHTAAPAERPGVLRRLAHSTAFWMTLFLTALILLFGILSHTFFQVSNFQNMALDASEAILLAVGSTLLLGARELDLSIGANLVLSSVLAGGTIQALAGTPAQVVAGEYPHIIQAIVVGTSVAIVSGIAFGLINALLVIRLRISSFIVTLGTTGIGTGTAYVITNGYNVPYLPRALQIDFGIKKLLDVAPYPTVMVMVVACVLWYLFNATRFGLYTRGIGSSREAAVRAGLNVDRHIVILFGLMGLLAGVAGVLDITRFATTNVSGHQTDALAAIAAAVIGGTSLFGGVASIGGAMIGALIPVVLGTGLVILGVQAFYQLIVVGVILIAAVYLDRRRRQALE